MKKILFTSLLFYLSSILFSPICLAADTAYVWLQESKVNLWQANGSLTPGTYVPANPSLCGTKPTGAGFTCYANTNKTTTFSADSGLPMIINPTDQLQIKIPFMDLGNITCEGSLAEKNQVCQIPWLANYINGIYNYLLGIAGLLATIVMMYGGLRWLASAGNPQAISDAKAWITGAVFGLILLFSTYIILNTVNPELTNLKSIKIGIVAKDEPEDETTYTDTDTGAAINMAGLTNAKFNTNTQNDLDSGKVQACAKQIITDLDKAGIPFRVTTLITGHDQFVKGTTRVSAHYNGKGIDIGCGASEQANCMALMKYISEQMKSEVGQAFYTPAMQYQWRAGQSYLKEVPGHGNHIHLGC